MSTEALIEDIFELSPMQQGMLFHSLYGLEAWAGVVQVGCVLRGRLDEHAFEQTWRRLLQRHQILRTCFFWDDFEKPLQVVQREVELPLTRKNLEGLAPAEQAAAVESFLSADRQHTFDISEAPLMRLTLLRLADDLHHFVWSFHHVLFDGWTSQLLFKEIFAMYDAASRGTELRLDPARPFREYIQWLQRQDMSASEKFWRELLAGFTSPTPLPLSRPATSATDEGYADYGLLRARLSEETTARLVALARRHRVTVNTLLLGAWGALLSRYSGEEDVVFGFTASGRPAGLPGVESMPGLFINTLPMRLNSDEREGLVGWLRRIQEQQVEAREYEYTPLAQLKGWSDVPGSLPLFESLVIFENYPLSEATSGQRLALDIGDIRIHEQTPYPLTVVGAMSGPQLSLQLSYERSRFTEAVVERIMRHLQTLLESFAENPERPLGEFGLLGEEERHQLLVEWNRTQAEYPREQTLHALVTAQAARTPQAVAVEYKDMALTYGELERRSNQLAQYLCRLGVGPEVKVGLYLERSPEMVVSLLAILKAGGAYVPLDPDYPLERLQFMTEDAGLTVVIAQSSTADALPVFWGMVVKVDEEWEEIGRESVEEPGIEVEAENLAYVIYTSGSTGVPKGVEVTHRGLASLAEAQIEQLGITSHSRVLQFASFSFDASVSELAMALTVGAALVLVGDEDRAGERLRQFLAARRITHATLPPVILATLPAGGGLPLEGMIVAGEACPPDLVERWSGVCRMFNGYGPTEATVCATMSAALVGGERPPIGRPLRNTRVYVLDAGLRPVPVGVTGELYVAGAGLARGYLKRPGLTAENFVPDPYGSDQGARMYRTGDLTRWRPDGVLDFVDRADRQLKIRGVRFEPAEVEGLIRETPGIADAAVVSVPREDGSVALAAYYVPDRRLELWPSIAEFYVYDDIIYTTMERDEYRNSRYRAAFARHLRDQVVVDVGTGPYAVLARLALEAGARRVYAIELLEESFKRARQFVAERGLADRIIVIQGDARTVQLPEPADWCVSEIVGSIGGSEGAADILQHARRLLRNPARMLPRRSVTKIAACELEEGTFHWGFPEIAARYVKRIFADVGRPFDLRLCVKNVGARHLLTDSGVFEDLDFTAPAPPEETHDLALEVTRSGRITGFLVWLNLELDERETVDILEHQGSWLPVYLPAFSNGLAVEPGDRISATVCRKLSAHGSNPDFTIRGIVRRAGVSDLDFSVETPHIADGFRQTFFHARLFADGQVPTLPQPSSANIRQRLLDKLPSFLVPTWFVELEALPLTPSGKLNREALPAPERQTESYVAPRTVEEEILASIWAGVLGVEQVSTTLDFFEAGGQSLLATQVISRVRDAFRVEITLKSLFDHPTVAGVARHIEELRAGGEKNLIPPIERTPRDVELPLSFAQQRLYFLDQLKPGSTVYIVPTAVRLSGQLDVRALERSLSTIFERHESLRTTFANSKGGPVQVIRPAEPLKLACVDLQDVREGEREEEARRLARIEAQTPFDLGRDLLMRAVLLRLSPDDHIFLLTLHHIVSDVWSVGVLVREVAALYRAYALDEEVTLPDLPVQYADYAVWQRGWLKGEVLDVQLSYWREQLAGAPALLELPSDKPRPPVPSLRGASTSFHLPASLSRGLKELSRRENSTLFMTLLAGFQALLYRYTGQTDIVVGTPIAGRNSVELEGLIGFFVNTLALRCRVEDGLSFAGLLARCRETTLGAYMHQDVPFEKLVEELQPERTLGHAPLVQVVFALQNTQQEAIELPELRLSSLPREDETAKFDLIFSLSDAPEGLALAVSYNTDIMDGSTVARMVEHYRNLLESALADPEQPVGELGLLGEAERQQMLYEWNQTEAAGGVDGAQTVAELFARQARQTPDATAVIFEGEQLTYAELNSRANQLAQHLRVLGVEPESKVGVMLHRGAGLVVSLLAVLKSGGAYVPLDPDYPQERLSILLEDSRPHVIIVGGDTQSRLPAYEAVRVNLDEGWETVTLEEAGAPAPVLTTDHTAYVCFTSGSTGRPKGVAVPHGALAARVRSMIETYGLHAGHRQLQFVSSSFDAFAEELFPTLCSGATLVLHPNPGAMTPREMLDFCERMSLTALHIPPAFWHLMVEELRASGRCAPESVKLFVTGGESPSPERLAQWLQLTAPDALFVNAYGPTETTITATAYLVRPGQQDFMRLARVPIGRPLHETQVYLLDAHMAPVPIGVAGELFIGGRGVARGYLHSPGLTAERFIPDPFSGEPGTRLYSTGDLARYLPDGQIEWLGRADEQVKINGHRIDLGEVEAALAQYESVRACVVAAREDRPGDKRLVAYAVVEGEGADAAALRGFLRDKLPEYEVPAAFVFLDELPLTANGKVDRRALPAPREVASSAAAEEAARPQSQVAAILISIWKDLLDVETVDPGDDFFALGGHSLLAVRLMGRINDHFGVELPLSTLFQGATVGQLEQVILEESDTQVWTHLAPIRASGSRPPFFCVHPAGGQVLCYAQLAQMLGPDQPFYGLEALDFVGVGESGDDYRTIEERAAAYVAAVKVVQPEGPYRVGGWSYGGIVAFEMARQLREQGQEVALLAILDSPAPLISQQIDDAQLLLGFALEVAAQAGREVDLQKNDLLGLSPDEQLDYVVGLLARAEVLPSDVDGVRVREQAYAVLRGSKIRSQSISDYEPRKYDGPITVFAADINPGWAREESVGELVAIYTEPTKGWSGLSTQPVRVIPVPGYHSTMLQEPHVSVLAERLGACLAEAAAEG